MDASTSHTVNLSMYSLLIHIRVEVIAEGIDALRYDLLASASRIDWLASMRSCGALDLHIPLQIFEMLSEDTNIPLTVIQRVFIA